MVTKPKRPRDPIALAKLIGDIATGQVDDSLQEKKPNPAADLGRKGGNARAAKLTEEQRKASAKKAIDARWSKDRKPALTEDTSSKKSPKRRAVIRPPAD